MLKEERDLLLKQILREYYEFLNMCKEETGIEALLKYSLWNYEILLEE